MLRMRLKMDTHECGDHFHVVMHCLECDHKFILPFPLTKKPNKEEQTVLIQTFGYEHKEDCPAEHPPLTEADIEMVKKTGGRLVVVTDPDVDPSKETLDKINRHKMN